MATKNSFCATDARNMALKSLASQVKQDIINIKYLIRSWARDGKYSVHATIRDKPLSYADGICKELESLGFFVTSTRAGNTTDLLISWFSEKKE